MEEIIILWSQKGIHVFADFCGTLRSTPQGEQFEVIWESSVPPKDCFTCKKSVFCMNCTLDFIKCLQSLHSDIVVSSHRMHRGL